MKYLINDNVISVILNGRPHNITRDSGYYDNAISAIKANSEKAIQVIVDKISALKNYVAPVAGTPSKVRIVGHSIYYGDSVVHNAVCNKIFTFMEKGLPFNPLLKFLENLLENPSKRSVDSLYEFIERHNLVIDEEGNVLAWKAVTSTLKDKHTGKIDNSPGKVVTVPRNSVSDDLNHGCHFGLHCGNWNYVRGFGGGNDRFILVKVNPKNVVCIPHDCSYEKMRVCEYEVVQEVTRDEVVAFDDSLKTLKPNVQVTPTVESKKNREEEIFDKLVEILKGREFFSNQTPRFSTEIGDELDESDYVAIENAFGLEYESIMDIVTMRDLVKTIKALT